MDTSHQQTDEKPERATPEKTRKFLDEIFKQGIDIDELPLEIREKYGLFEELNEDD